MGLLSRDADMNTSLLGGQRALVTGASSGIGKTIAIALAEAGAQVLIQYHSDEQEAQEAAELIRGRGGHAAVAQADVGRIEEIGPLFAAMDQHFGGLDILIANAGIQRDAPFTELTIEQWKRVIDVNLTGQFVCAQEAVRRFRQQGTTAHSRARGKIIFTNSVHQVIPWAGHANYAASKGGLKLLMETMAQELAGEKIRVNAIAPGAIKTPINQDAWQTKEAIEKLLRLIPYGRIGEPEDVARAAVWLASDESDYVVGTTLFVDGGMVLYPAFRDNG